jgi:hypothetical protein
MVTAAAPVSPDSHALPQPAAVTSASSASSPASFRSVYQSLPLLPVDPSSEISNSKGPVTKKSSPKAADNKMLAPVNLPATADSAPSRPWAPALPSSPLGAPRTAGEPEPASGEVAQLSMPERALPTADLAQKAVNVRESSLLAPTRSGASNPIQSGVTGSRNASATEPEPAREVAQIQMSGQSLPSDLMQNPANLPDPSLPAPVRNGASNLLQPGVAVSNSASAAAARSLAGYREQASNSQAPASTPSILLGAPSSPAAKQASLPESRQPENSSRSTEMEASAQPAIDPALFTKGLAATLAPQSKNLAFSLKMVESNSVARHAQQAQEPEPAARNQAANSQTKSEEHAAEPALASSGTHASTPAPTAVAGGEAATATAATVNPVWNQAAATAQLNAPANAQFSEPHQPVNISTVTALHEARPVMPEAPRPTAASEILLQLGGKDQAAAIRVSDRAGTVNVSVHATDGDLRSSLRSNLGDLASQLTHQGWKTEVVKTGTSLTRGETSQDPQQDGQRSPGQQPSSQGERQPQRDRRTSSGQWQAEFEEQTTGSHEGYSGGTN